MHCHENPAIRHSCLPPPRGEGRGGGFTTATPGSPGRILTTAELRQPKPDRADFQALPRRKLRIVLDGVRQNVNIGAIFRLADAMLVERLVICGAPVELHKRKLVQTARGTPRWVPWEAAASAVGAVAAARAAGYRIVAAELTTASLNPEQLPIDRPICLVLGNEDTGISPAVLDLADCSVAVPMLGMGNSLNVATAAAILMYHAARLMEDTSRSDASLV